MKYLLPILMVIACVSAQGIDLWVMSQCPYGARALYVVGTLDETPNHKTTTSAAGVIRIRYILSYDEETGEFRSLHGENEVEEDIRQMVIQKYFPQYFWCYFRSRASHFYDTLWVKDALICGLDTAEVERTMSEEGKKLAIADAKLCDSLGVDASPTLFIDGKRVPDWRGDFPSLYIIARNAGLEIGLAPARQGLPECFDDGDCLPESDRHIAKCVDGECVSELAVEVHLTVVLPDTTFGDISKKMVKIFHRLFRGLVVDYVDYDTREGKELIKRFDIEKLPAYIFESDVQNDEQYDKIHERLLLVRNGKKLWFLVKPQAVDASFFPLREKHEGEIAIFAMSECPFSRALEESLYAEGKTDNIVIHYIVQKDSATGEFRSLHGNGELAENRRQIIIQKYFPDKFWEYLSCVNKTDFSDTCIAYAGIDTDSLQKLVNVYANSLLSEDASLCEELGIFGSPTIFWKNRQIIFGTDNLNKLLGVSAIEGKCQK